MTDLILALRALVNEPRGFQTGHPTLAAWLPIDVGNAAKTLVEAGVLTKGRDGYTGRVFYRGAQLPRMRRTNASGTAQAAAGDRLVDVMRRLALTHPQGFATCHPDLAARWSGETVGKSAAHLVRRGELTKVRVSHKLVYYFATLELAQIGEAKLLAQSTNSSHSKVSIAVAQPLRGPADFSRAKLTVCPPFVPRNVALDVLCPMLRQAPYRRAA